MINPDWERVKEIFAEAIERPVGLRLDFLKRECNGDDHLFNEVSSLLSASADPENLIENNIIDLAANVSGHTRECSDQHFGHYKIIREIGSGGMGTVFLATRDDGEFTKQAALKIVRQSIAESAVIARFKRERQILADLNHPNIAVLYDGGVNEKGEPYLAMEYVDGDTLIEYAKRHRLSIPEKLELFLKICSAVSYAHRSLVVHRDIKPSNILVTRDGEPKLLDFGLARGFESDASKTQTALRAFTPAYASPEQIQGQNITTASDIYSLGVVFYELLTGAKPLNFENRSFDEIIQTINHTEPIRPSAVEADVNRDDSNRLLRGDLDNIALTALRKEPERRFKTVDDFAEDIKRHLDGRPISARPNTAGYRGGKFIRRNKIGVAAFLLVSVALLAGLTMSLWQAAIARRETARSQAVNRFLQKMLMTAIPESGTGGKMGAQATIIDVLDEAEKRLDGEELYSENEVRSELRQVIGEGYLSQGMYDAAERNLTRALNEQSLLFGRESRQTLKSEFSLASLYLAQADYDHALNIYERRFAALRTEFRNGRVEPEFYLTKMSDYAVACRADGDADRAESLLRETIALATEFSLNVHLDASKSLLTLILLDQGRFEEAKSAQIGLVTKLRESVSNENVVLAPALTLLGSILMEKGELKEAESTLIEGETVYRKLYGPGYTAIYDNIRLQAQVAYLIGDYQTAERKIDLALDNYREHSSPKYISFATALTTKGLIVNKLGRSKDAENLLREALLLRTENLPPRHFMTALTKGSLGEFLLDQRRYGEAEPLLRESLDSLRESQKTNNPRLQLASERVSRLKSETGTF